VLGTLFRGRGVARVAVAGLAIGLAGLAGLAYWSTTSTARATYQIRQIEEISKHWAQVSLLIDVERDALDDYLRAGSEIGHQPLVSSLGSATPSLRWLQTSAGPEEAARAASVAKTYEAYTETLRELVSAGNRGDRAQVMLYAEQANLGASSLRKLSLANTERERQDLGAYIALVNQQNQRLRLAAEIIGLVDFLLLALCSLALLNHQRRIERQAVESRHQALHDSLTGVANRVLLSDRMERALLLAARRGGVVALLLLDLNRFKEINDTLGHHHGDLLLQEVAQRIAGVIRDHDTVARLGGDEFAVLLPEVHSEEATMRVAHRILEALRTPADLGGTVVDISASIGAALYPAHCDTAAELLQHADIAMYAAKRGHLGTVIYDPEVNQHSYQQLSLFGELRHAIEFDELVLHYQPKIEALEGRCCGVEALVRWQHPKRGLLLPGEFIPLAERTDLIRPLTDWVLREALRQHRVWRESGIVVSIAVNVAASCLLDPAFPEQVAALLARYEMLPALLTLEITESAMITDQARAAATLEHLNGLGIRLAIDDFGAGYSSMSHLQTMPLAELKVDRRFIGTLGRSDKDAAIVRAILEMAHALGVAVVAEGVEDRATWTSLRAMGCDAAQGYHFCKPMPVGDLLTWLAEPGRLAPVGMMAAPGARQPIGS
jgi:diguanylate cyclase (GGDEF)-like protein